MTSKRIKLFCIPHAGGAANIYTQWERILYEWIDLQPIELAGRGKRFNQELCKDFDQVLNDICEIIVSKIDKSPIALFGHSLGSLITYELSHMLKNNLNIQPIHVFLSGGRPPHTLNSMKKIHGLSDEDFINEIFSYGGIPKKLVENRELLDLFLPILRADFEVVESYKYLKKDQKLKHDITVLYGEHDNCTGKPNIDEWKMYTDKSCNLRIFEGGHFFNIEKASEVVKIINSTLNEYF